MNDDVAKKVRAVGCVLVVLGLIMCALSITMCVLIF